MSRLRQDLAYAIRTFAKAPGFALIAVLVLGAGIGANTAIFTIVNELLFRPLSGRAGELVGIYSRDRTQPDAYRGFSYPNYVDVRDRSGVFEAVLAQTFCLIGMPAGEETRRTFAAVVSSNYFDALGVRLAAGRPFSAEEERPGAQTRVAIVTYGRWKAGGFDPSFVGKTIRINADDYTIVGVAPESFSGTTALVSADLYLPIGVFDAVVNDRFRSTSEGTGSRASTDFVLAGRLRPDVSEAMAASRLDTLSRQLEAAYPAENKNQALSFSRLPRVAVSTRPQEDTGLQAFAGLLMGLSGVVLVIACLNIANMLLARGSARRKELALRLALGAARVRIIRQLLTESVLLALAGAALGLASSFWITKALSSSISAAMPLTVVFSTRPDASVLLATLAFAALSTVAFGLGPALRLSRRDLVADLKDRSADGAASGRRFGARNLMVIGQVGLSLAMLTAAGIFARTALAAASGNPGHSYDRLLVANVDAGLAAFDETHGRTAYRAVLDRLRSQPDVSAATIASTLPFGDVQEGERFERVGAGQQDPVSARTYRVIGADYFSSLGLRMVRGREFTRAEEEDPSAPAVAIVDEAYARRLFPDEDPIGQ
jgi:predicted permease